MTQPLTEAQLRRRSGIKYSLGCLAVVLSGMVVFYFYLQSIMWHPAPSVFSEIGALHDLLNDYKEHHAEYPPCCAETSVADRRVRFIRHLAKAYPTSAYGLGEDDYLKLREAIRTPDGFGGASQPYNYRRSEGIIAFLDLDTLDPAEALVFWLGGFPTPVLPNGESIAPCRLFGFNKDRDNPLRRDSVVQESTGTMRFRADPYFDFHQYRLRDADDDGWLEYVPQYADDEKLAPPYVYFDGDTYVSAMHDPAMRGTVRYPAGGPNPDKLAEHWGTATPYLESFDPARPAEAVYYKKNQFQIIAAGRDCRYGPKLSAETRRFVVLPSCRVWTSDDGGPIQAGELSTDERDNNTNLSKSTIGEWSSK